ncbi:hypothetical protein J3366_07575 [Tritonibacter mobilis]
MLRPILWEDIRSLARALLAHPASRRAALCRQILQGASRARHQTEATGRCHPHWGDGSLDRAARSFPLADEPFPGDPDYARCLQMVLGVVAAGHKKTPRREQQPGCSSY